MDQSSSSAHHRELEAEIRKLDLTPGGSAWLSKALYPPGIGTSVSVPDGAYAPAVRGDYRPSYVIKAPIMPDPEDTWDCCIVTLPGDCNAALVMVGVSGLVNFVTGSGTLVQWVRNIDRGGSNPVLAVNRNTAGGAANVTFNSTYSATATQAFRSTYKSLTVHMTASSLYDGGSVTAAQFPIDWTGSNAFALALRDGLNYVAARRWACLPLDEQHMRQSAPGSHVGEARQGVYMPMRLKGPSQSFVGLAPAESLTLIGTAAIDASSLRTPGGGAIYLPVCALASSGFSDATGVVNPYLSTLGNGTGNWIAPDPSSCEDTAYDNYNTGVVIFRGLSPQATLTLQVYQGLEMVVAPTSALITFARSPEPRDERALAAYSSIVSRMGYVYPAKYNALGLILPLIASALRMAAPYVLPALRGLATTLVPMAASAVMSKLQGRAPTPAVPRVAAPPVRSSSARSTSTRVSIRVPLKKKNKRRQ